MRKLRALDPEVQAVIAETMTNWRRRQLDRYTRYVLADVCPNPAEHDRLMGQREQTWREPARAASGECSWCGGRLP